MGDLSKNLSRREFKCRCGCGFDTVDFHLVNILQATVNHFANKRNRDVRIDITGGNRCKKHNDELRATFIRTGGKLGSNTAINSQHIYARAADFKLFYRDENEQIEPEDIYEYLGEEYGNKIARGLYVNRCHVDTRTDAGQKWDKT